MPELNWTDLYGWTDFEDVYAEAVRLVPAGGTLVEVGVWHGKSLAMLCQHVRTAGKDQKVVAVDNFMGSTCDKLDETVRQMPVTLYDTFIDNMTKCGCIDLVSKIVSADSAEAAKSFPDASLDFVFIDANHEDDAVRRDISAWLPKVKPGGILAGHDINRSSVYHPVCELVPGWRSVGVSGMCWWYDVPPATS